MNLSRIVIFTDEPGWHGRVLTQAFGRLGFQCRYASLTSCRLNLEPGLLPVEIPGFEERMPDAAFVRGVPGGSLEEVTFYLDILHALKLMGIPVYNDGRAIERSVDKAMTSFLLSQANIPTPRTWVLRSRDEAISIAESELSMGNKLLAKPLFGSQGDGIKRLEKSTDLLWLTASNGIYYLQKFVHCAGEGFSDYRVFVIRNQAVAIMRRRGKSWLNNVAQGALCEAIELEKNVAELAVKATIALAMDYSGVDIIQDRSGRYLVIEVNSIPAWKGLQSVAHINVAQLLAEDLIGRVTGRELPEITGSYPETSTAIPD